MYTDDNNSESDNDQDEKVFFILLILITEMGIKPSTSLKQILESGQVLKVDLWEIRLIAPLLFDFLFCFPTHVLNRNPM